VGYLRLGDVLFVDNGMHDEVGSRCIDELEAERDDILLGFSNCATSVWRWSLAKRPAHGVVFSRSASSGQVGGLWEVLEVNFL
jgi:hypothetical protein